ncbi:hypothetical protein [Parendozoicomonas haliclonae]|uniref:Uncharacterized protein n=1 Tax=Parendozoicomonas haliclonae TaxID=1960125 RepID=A0A1X7AR29_9GAMM|nr:hypothetical protein [Parendozoicomonas haliclonae]SMA50549.1 hypothetical protein EHSB41UT_04360 [Parendozoicomonas haliclonae]
MPKVVTRSQSRQARLAKNNPLPAKGSYRGASVTVKKIDTGQPKKPMMPARRYSDGGEMSCDEIAAGRSLSDYMKKALTVPTLGKMKGIIEYVATKIEQGSSSDRSFITAATGTLKIDVNYALALKEAGIELDGEHKLDSVIAELDRELVIRLRTTGLRH